MLRRRESAGPYEPNGWITKKGVVIGACVLGLGIVGWHEGSRLEQQAVERIEATIADVRACAAGSKPVTVEEEYPGVVLTCGGAILDIKLSPQTGAIEPDFSKTVARLDRETQNRDNDLNIYLAIGGLLAGAVIVGVAPLIPDALRRERRQSDSH